RAQRRIAGDDAAALRAVGTAALDDAAGNGRCGIVVVDLRVAIAGDVAPQDRAMQRRAGVVRVARAAVVEDRAAPRGGLAAEPHVGQQHAAIAAAADVVVDRATVVAGAVAVEGRVADPRGRHAAAGRVVADRAAVAGAVAAEADAVEQRAAVALPAVVEDRAALAG